MAAKQLLTKQLTCPVCLDIYKDPRISPCEAGGHTVCKECIDMLLKDSSFRCPMCKDDHDITRGETNIFIRNMAISGLIDSFCGECWNRAPNGMCDHCGINICDGCRSSHIIFANAEASLKELDATLFEALDLANEPAIGLLLLDMEKKVDNGVNYLIQKLEERRVKLKAEQRIRIKKDVRSREPWKMRLELSMDAAKMYLDAKTKKLGERYSDDISDQTMIDIQTKSKENIAEIKQYIKKAPVVSIPEFTLDNKDAIDVISYYGSRR